MQPAAREQRGRRIQGTIHIMNTIVRLNGLRLLLVEDEALVAMLVHDIVSGAGASIVYAAPDVEGAIAMLDSEPIDGAILDVNLSGEMVDAVADELTARNIPFLFLTGYGRSGIAERFPDATVVNKPFEDAHFLAAVSRVLVKERSALG
jgi:CheY-like chemotaxis protein